MSWISGGLFFVELSIMLPLKVEETGVVHDIESSKFEIKSDSVCVPKFRYFSVELVHIDILVK